MILLHVLQGVFGVSRDKVVESTFLVVIFCCGGSLSESNDRGGSWIISLLVESRISGLDRTRGSVL